MPIREYKANNSQTACAYCARGFEQIEALAAPLLKTCPRCGAKVSRQISNINPGASQSGLDDRAKQAGFQKLKRLGKGEYEKQY